MLAFYLPLPSIPKPAALLMLSILGNIITIHSGTEAESSVSAQPPPAPFLLSTLALISLQSSKGNRVHISCHLLHWLCASSHPNLLNDYAIPSSRFLASPHPIIFHNASRVTFLK